MSSRPFSRISLLAGLVFLLGVAVSAAQASPKTELQALLDATAQAGTLPSLELRVYRSRDDQLVLQQSAGGFQAEQALEIASATKWVTATAFLVLITEGRLRLDTTTGQVLGWEGRLGEITLRQLLSFTSGLKDHLCTKNPGRSLESCTGLIQRTNREGPAQASTYSYNAADYTVAGRMAEVVMGRPWVKIFEQALRGPLQLSDSVNYWGIWIRGRPSENPGLAGTMVATADDYAKVLRLIDDRGRLPNGRQLIKPELIDTMLSSQYVHPIQIGSHPARDLGFPDWEYGLGNWVECEGPQKCDGAIHSSEGAYGYYPWIDRKNGYYAILATRGEFSLRKRPTQASVDLVMKARPLILQLLK